MHVTIAMWLWHYIQPLRHNHNIILELNNNTYQNNTHINTNSILYIFGLQTLWIEGMISLINSERLKNGLRACGWLNPALYLFSPHEVFTNDITSGNNKCTALGRSGEPVCCEQGFYALQQWDPVSGWGSINFQNMLDLFMNINNTTYHYQSKSPLGTTSGAVTNATATVIISSCLAGFAFLVLGMVLYYWRTGTCTTSSLCYGRVHVHPLAHDVTNLA